VSDEPAVGVLVVGAGAAGSACAEALREGGFAGSVLVAGRDADPPYERPHASKGYLAGALERDETFLHPPAWWEEQGVDLRLRTSVMKLDPGARTAKLSSGETVRWEHAVLATGANVRRLRVDGAALEGVHYLRALGNADAIRRDAEGAERVVVVGGSYIACEVAATLTAAGRRVAMVAEEELPLSRGFGDTVGRWALALLRDRGIEWAGADPLAGFAGDERVERVVTASGRALTADLVVMGTGVVPDVMLARSAGLELGETGGVACSAALRASAPGVWCAGDACEYDSVLHGRRARVEHWEVARAQGAAVARGILGDEAPYAEVPYFWSDLADWATLEYVGAAPCWDAEVVRGSLEDGAFTIFHVADSRVVGALTCGRGEDLDLARRLIVDRAEVGPSGEGLPER
jgi:3-phenylpropionate/trans-cinnamate dioxygenase ferredoxin reductase component